MKVTKKMVWITGLVTVVCLGILLFAQSQIEKSTFSNQQLKEEQKTKASLDIALRDLSNNESMSVSDWYVGRLGYSEQAMKKFKDKFNRDPQVITNKEVTEEEFEFLDAMNFIDRNSEVPILTKNAKEKNDLEGPSLEDVLSALNQVTPNQDTEKIIQEICEKHGINPEGNQGTLTVEAVDEIKEKFSQEFTKIK
ncbi:hypothetical protein [Vagococcus silagei]|uniref:Uncharacterized protein n=1 Tax=Vagococcus silagei TaxID=2508885 RepID=A0A4S3B623_9ENTE|nr:hypothetical protein [Vagococcus silagei]THB61143.1 hypothetical protein ESZ54_06385 [Vagococcus silagei]